MHHATRAVSKVTLFFLNPCGWWEKFESYTEVVSGCSGSTVKFLCIYLHRTDSCMPASMETALTPTADCEVCAVIHFLVAKKKNATKIHCELCSVYGKDIMSRPIVSRWRLSFMEGRATLNDEQRSGQLSTSRAPNIDEFCRILDTDQCLTLDETLFQLPPNVEISRTSLHKIISEDLRISVAFLFFAAKKTNNSTNFAI